MAKKGGPSIRGMHIAFGIASVLLLITTVYAFVQDHYGRDFPQYQEKYDAAMKQVLEVELKQAERKKKDYEDRLSELGEQIAAAKEEMGAQSETLERERKKIETIDNSGLGRPGADGKERSTGGLQLARRELNFLKADRDELKYQADHYKPADGKASAKYEQALKKLAVQEKLIAEKFADVAFLEGERDKAEAVLSKIEGPHKEKLKEQERIAAIVKDLEVKIKKLVGNPVINFAKDAPGLDFVQPRRHVEHVILKNLPYDYLMATSMRTDRCMTCHKAIDNPDPRFGKDRDENLDPVLRSHPRLDLFVGATSPHSMKMFGCTICHQGKPMGVVSFSSAAHTPRNQEQAKEWKKKYNWEPLAYWDYKMLPVQHTEASCLKCHKGLDEVPQAHKLNEGRELFRSKGCTNCHIGTADKDLAWVGRVGPDLRRIGEKTTQAWARQWILNPWDFRPTTTMPRFFGLENRADLTLDLRTGSSWDGVHNAPADENHIARDPVEAEAISAYLFTASKLREKIPPEPANGDKEAGKTLFQGLGCVGCHSTREKGAGEKFEINDHGPDLSRIGDKVTRGWLYAWLKNPRHYWPETKMPSLRLSDKEAQDITEYLMDAMRKAPIPEPPRAPEAAFESIIRDKFRSKYTQEQITAMLDNPAAMMEKRTLQLEIKPNDAGEWTQAQIDEIKKHLGQDTRAIKAFYAGQLVIQHNGCYGCHNIQGWTYAPLTAPNLVGEGEKDLDKFDFGKALGDGSLASTKWDWFETKIARPRVYDKGKEDLIQSFDRLRMPWFGYKRDPDAAPHGAYSRNSEHAPQHEHGLTETEVQRLVTHLLSLNVELDSTGAPAVPLQMQHLPTKDEIALDRGRRVIRELNCAGCHLVGQDNRTLAGSPTPREIKLEALVALLPSLGGGWKLERPSDRIFVDEDAAVVDFPENLAPGSWTDGTSMPGLVSIQRGTFLTRSVVEALLYEKKVRPSALKPWEAAKFQLKKGAPKKGWIAYTELVSQEQFVAMTRAFFQTEEAAKAEYEILKQYSVEQDAYERIAGTEALYSAYERAGMDADHKIGLNFVEVEDRRREKKFYEPVTLKVRLTHGEGRIIDHIVNFEKQQRPGVDISFTAGVSQQGPPSLGFEGGKVQPDWLYQFLRNVHTIRPGLTVRMPSFWTDGPYSSYKAIYPAGHLSAVDPARRIRGIGGEPQPSPEAVKFSDIADDAAQLAEFFMRDAGEKPFGFQPLPISDDTRKLYADGKRLATGDKTTDMAGICMECHYFGQRKPTQDKWAPDLAQVKRRLKGDWLRRFLSSPNTLYPWTNMPNNFGLGWSDDYPFDVGDAHRGLKKGNVPFEERVRRLQAVHYFLMHAGEEEVGAGVPPQAAPKPEAPKPGK